MAAEVVQCPHCQGREVVKYGTASNGKERFRCQRAEHCGRTFIRAYTYPGRTPEVKRQIVEMTLKGSGVRDIARVLHISPSTVIGELKKGQCALPGQYRRRGGVLSRRGHDRGPWCGGRRDR
jgi:transposase-like protein